MIVKACLNMANWGKLAALFVIVVVTGSSAVQQPAMILDIQPTKAGIKTNSQIAIMCSSDRALVGCKFWIRHNSISHNTTMDIEGPMLDFSDEKFPPKQAINANLYQNEQKLYTAQYYGKGLMASECGILLTKVSEGRYFVGCRARNQDGDWAEKYMALFVKDMITSFNRTHPETELTKIVKLGNNETIDFKVERKNKTIAVCNIYLQSTIIKTMPSGTFRRSENIQLTRYRNSCSMLLLPVSEKHNGLTWAEAPLKGNENSTWYFMKMIIVSKAPSLQTIVLKVEPYQEGTLLNATCSVAKSRPVANITWFLQEKQLTAANGIEDPWTWPWQVVSIHRKISIKLAPDDKGKVLTCKVQHFALEKYEVKQHIINFTRTQDSTGMVAWKKGQFPMHPTGRSINSGKHQIIIIGVSFIVVAIVMLAAVVYAKARKILCFHQAENEREATQIGMTAAETILATSRVPKGRPRAASPVQDKPTTTRSVDKKGEPERNPNCMVVPKQSHNDVVYIELADFSPAAGSKAKDKASETTYAKLNFH